MHTDDEHELRGDKESYLCAVCLDVYFNPYMCYPCHHIFCEPCLRMLAKDNPASTPCPLCRTTIARVFFQTGIKFKVFTIQKNICSFPSCISGLKKYMVIYGKTLLTKNSHKRKKELIICNGPYPKCMQTKIW